MKVMDRGRRDRLSNFEALTTQQLLALHERHFGPLDAKSKARIVDGALMRGWDRTWDTSPWGTDGLAA